MAILQRNSVLWKPPLGARLNRSHSTAQGIVGCWLMNEGGGTVVQDLSFGRHAGTTKNSYNEPPTPVIRWASGQSGPCLSLAGGTDSDFVDIGHDVGFSSGPFTIIARINLTASGAANTIVGGYDALYPQFRVIADTTLDLVYQQDSQMGASTGTVTPGAWTTVAVTYANPVVTFYINGVACGTASSAKTFTSRTTHIGGRNNGTYECFGGKIDWVLIYSRVLSSAEIQQLYTQPFAMFRRAGMGLWTVGGATNITVTPNSLGTTLTLQTPGVCYDYKVTPSVLALLLSEQTPNITYDYKISPAALALLLTLQTPGVNYGYKVSPPTQVLSLTLQETVQNYDFKFSADTLAMLLATPNSTVKYDFKVALGAALELVLGLQSPDVGSQINVTVLPTTQTLVLSLQSVGISYDFKFSAGVLALLLTGQTPSLKYDYTVAISSALALAITLQTPGVGSGISINVSADPMGLMVSVQTPILSYDYLMAIASSLGLICTLKTPTIPVGTGRTYIVCSSTDPAILDIYAGGVLVARFTNP
jgi:hypothetical protein